MAVDERGDATTEAVLITPVLLLIIGVVINLALWYHASSIARAGAQEGVRAAATVNGTSNDGQRTAELFISQLGNTLVQDRSVTVSRDDVNSNVEVTGKAPAVVPGLKLNVRANASRPNEIFRPAP